MLVHPQTILGIGDAGAHCGAICDGGWPTFLLTHWARDRSRGPQLPLGLLVQKQTRDTAWTFGICDRGVLAPGYRADVNVIDIDRLGLLAPEAAYDLPLGGRRLLQRARGYRHTFCAGVEVTINDAPTGALPGKLLRNPRSRARRRDATGGSRRVVVDRDAIAAQRRAAERELSGEVTNMYQQAAKSRL